jgi:hypothetical protein
MTNSFALPTRRYSRRRALSLVPPAFPVTFVADDLAALGQGRLPFIRDADGQIGWIALGLRLIPRV